MYEDMNCMAAAKMTYVGTIGPIYRKAAITNRVRKSHNCSLERATVPGRGGRMSPWMFDGSNNHRKRGFSGTSSAGQELGTTHGGAPWAGA